MIFNILKACDRHKSAEKNRFYFSDYLRYGHQLMKFNVFNFQFFVGLENVANLLGNTMKIQTFS